MKASNNNRLRRGALFSLFITSYLPLFAIVIVKQLNEGSAFLCWGGWNKAAISCFLSHFGMSVFLSVLSIVGIVGITDRKDFETVIKAMCDYYKKGEVSGKSYGTFSGRELKEVGEGKM